MGNELVPIKEDENDLIFQDGDYVIQIRNIDHLLPRGLGIDFGITRGWGNGYVGLPSGHAWYGLDYDEIDVDIHGGLTFGEELEINNVKYYVIGFDTAHYSDNLNNWPKSKVLQETVNLLDQCKNAKSRLLQ